jgi:hypothetical protein
MTNTMQRGEVTGLSDEIIAKMRQRFGDECKRLLERMSTHAECTCGKGAESSTEHDPSCPVAAWREAAHAVWMWGHP